MVNVRKYPDRKITVFVFSQNSLDDRNTLIDRYQLVVVPEQEERRDSQRSQCRNGVVDRLLLEPQDAAAYRFANSLRRCREAALNESSCCTRLGCTTVFVRASSSSAFSLHSQNGVRSTCSSKCLGARCWLLEHHLRPRLARAAHSHSRRSSVPPVTRLDRTQQ